MTARAELDAGAAPDLHALLRPETIAAIGASSDADRLSGRILANLRRFGFAGRLVSVNRRGAAPDGIEVVRSIAELEGPVDLAFVSVPPTEVVDVLQECADEGTPNAVVLTSGFEGAAGAERRAELGARLPQLRERGLRVLGPNCIGVVNVADRIVVRPAMFLPRLPDPGGVAVVSQSGGLSLGVLNEAAARGVGLRYVVHTGNEADLGLEDFLAHAADDPGCEAIALSIEQIRRPRDFVAAARRAADRGKTLTYLKVGRSARGALTAMTHTGAVAGDATLYDSFLADLGFHSVDTPADLVLAADPLWPKPTARGYAIVSISGGEAGLAADLADRERVPLAPPGPLPRLDERLGVEPSNPVDVTGHAYAHPVVIEEAVRDLAGQPACDGIVVSFPPIAEEHFRSFTDPLVATNAELGGRVAVVCPTVSENAFDMARRLRAEGLAVYQSLEDALWKAAFASNGEPAPATPEPPSGEHVHLSEVVAELTARGVPGPRLEVVADDASLAAVAASVGYPVAAKVEHPAVAHRARAGLMVTGIEDPDALRAAVVRLRETAAAAGLPGAVTVVQELVPAVASELLVGYRRDDHFGDVLVVGRGGVEAGAERDDRASLLQVFADVDEGARRAATVAVERGWVGADVDLDALIAAIAGIWNVGRGARFDEWEVNPLLVDAAGRPWAVDGVGLRRFDTRSPGA